MHTIPWAGRIRFNGFGPRPGLTILAYLLFSLVLWAMVERATQVHVSTAMWRVLDLNGLLALGVGWVIPFLLACWLTEALDGTLVSKAICLAGAGLVSGQGAVHLANGTVPSDLGWGIPAAVGTGVLVAVLVMDLQANRGRV